jgi:hypothetical protein
VVSLAAKKKLAPKKTAKIKAARPNKDNISLDEFMKKNHIEMVPDEKPKSKFRRVPLANSFLLASIILFVACGLYTAFGRIEPTWGLTFSVVFLIMIIASIISVQPE